ncbi:MAG: hypothetical protein LBI72_13500 [Flavobacteriaceae bacterium]|jgi:hypothetical protein|nr:hypothetical protein [Flavobacteriaceae bacterium]
MNNLYKKYIFFIALIIGFIYVVETNRKSPISWDPNYDTTSKQPMGLYILDKELDHLIGDKKKLIRDDLSLYTMLDTLTNLNKEPKNLLLINHYIDDYEATATKMEDFVSEGNNVFIIGNLYLESDILKTIGMRIYISEDNANIENDTVKVNLTNSKFSTANYTITQSSNGRIFIPDSIRNKVEVLGYGTHYTGKLPNYIRVPYGKGNYYIHTDPSAFTNVNLLESNNHLYVEGALSYLGDRTTYFMVTEKDETVRESTSVLRYILLNDSLRWAWYLFLIALVLFSLFHAKRKQRVIPIIKPLENTTVDFTHTVSNLYIKYQDYEDIINKSIIYTLEKIRRKYYIDTAILDEKFVHNYYRKSGKSKEDIQAFVTFVERFRAYPKIANESNLIKLNELTEKIID